MFNKTQAEPGSLYEPEAYRPNLVFKGGEKPKKAKVTPIVSPYAGMNEASFDSPFGSGSSVYEPYQYTDPLTGAVSTKNRINTSATLNPQLQESADLAQTGLSSNLSYLQRNPLEQVNFATGGNDPYYNVLNEQAQRQYELAVGRSKIDAQRTGGTNSTALGANLGMLGYNKQLLDNQILLNSLQYGNQQATQNTGTNLGVIGGLANLVNPLATTANNNLNIGMQDQGRAQAATAQAMNAAEAQYRQQMNAYNQQQASIGGNIMGAVTSMGGILPGAIAGGITGGGQGAIAGGLGGAAGSMAYIGGAMGMPSGGNNFGSAPNIGSSYTPSYNSVLNPYGMQNALYSGPDMALIA